MGLRDFVIRRFITGFITLLLVIASNFILFRLPAFITGVDPAVLYGIQDAMRNPNIAKDLIQKYREQWGIPPPNAPISVWIEHFEKYLYNMLTFNFGRTFKLQRPVIVEFANRLPLTLLMIGTATILSILIGIWLGVRIGSKPGSKLDVSMMTFGIALYALPSFWVGLLFYQIFISQLRIFQTGFAGTESAYSDPLLMFLFTMYVLTPPIIVLVIVSFGGWMLLMRTSLVDVMSEDFIITARAKGLDERTILYKHAFRNALLPVVTSVTLAIAGIWTGSIVAEYIFQIKGMGQLFIWAYDNNEYALLEMLFYFVALTTILANIIADISYALLDPRVRY